MAARVLRPLLLTVVTGVVSVSMAQESPETISIESARREFGTLHEATGIAPGERLKVPQINASQMVRPDGAASAPITTRRQTLEERRQKERDENWLLEAMLENPEDADHAADSLEKEQEALTADPFEQMIAEQLSPAKQEESEETRLAEAEALRDQVVNPLTEYMSSWVSERDRQLLLPETGAKDAKVGSLQSSPISTARHPVEAAPFLDLGGQGQPNQTVRFGGTANPYLDQETPVVVEPVSSEAPRNFAEPEVPLPQPAVVETAPPRGLPVSSEQPMNRNDEAKKYFPQLKRF